MAGKKQPKRIEITKRPHQVSSTGGQFPNYLDRLLPVWNNPGWMKSDAWRVFVQKQPVAVLCRDAISSYLLSLDWKIVARDSEQQDELKDDIKYYTRLFERGNAYYTDIDFTNHIEWVVRDLFDLSFGTASEIGREYNSPTGKVVWVRPLDGGTLAPTLDADYPIAQYPPNSMPIYFPRDFISRVYLSPRTELTREGWGMAPPEKIYLAMEMLNRGDVYYSRLLLNTPEAGILDLGDMDGESAKEWISGFRDLLFGIEPLKIPVLYEHTSEAKFIPFGKNPSEIMYDSTLAKYVTIVTAGYGLTPSDIGFSSSSNGGETLAGTIRQERRSARSGKALAKKKLKIYFDNILPDNLMFMWVDFDDETNVAKSRARLASAGAFKTFTEMQAFSPDEVRRQAIADGLFDIVLPETIDRSKIQWATNTLRYVGKDAGGGEIAEKKTPANGGQGETIPQQVISRSRAKIEVALSKTIYQSNQILGALISSVRNDQNDLVGWEKSFDDAVVGKSKADLVTESVIDDVYGSLVDILDQSEWIDTVSKDVANFLSTTISETRRSTIERILTNKAETEYMEGIRDDISLTEEELLEIENFDKKQDLFLGVKSALISALIPKIILVSKSSLLGHKYTLDTKDNTDNNNLRLAREISEKVYQLLPSVLLEVQNTIMNEDIK